jgi:hypothetical protein
LGERCLRKAEAGGSNPLISTMDAAGLRARRFRFPEDRWPTGDSVLIERIG